MHRQTILSSQKNGGPNRHRNSVLNRFQNRRVFAVSRSCVVSPFTDRLFICDELAAHSCSAPSSAAPCAGQSCVQSSAVAQLFLFFCLRGAFSLLVLAIHGQHCAFSGSGCLSSGVSRRIFVYQPSSIAELSSLAAESRSGLTGSKREENERRNTGGKAGALPAPTAPRRS